MKPVTQMLRAFIETDPPKRKGPGRRGKSPRDEQKIEMAEIERLLGPDAWPWFGPMLIFDCETTTDIGQKLRFGVFQERGLNYRDLVERKRLNGRIAREDMDEQRSEGIFYSPATCSEAEIETMCAHAEKHGLRFLTVEKFLYTVFYRLYYYKRWREGDPALTLPMLVIGHNLPFDLGAVSYSAGPSKGRNYGGLTLKLTDKRPSIAIKKLGFGKHLFSAHQNWNKRRNLQFVDTQQLSRALLGPGGNSISGLLKKLKITDAKKSQADYDGPITPEYIEYCRGDVFATWRIFQELRALYRKHGRTREIDQIYSEASLGKAYLMDFGIKPFLQQNPGFDRRMIGPFMEALYGGRSEVRVRHELRETIQADCRSQYSTINALMRLQELMIAESVEAIEGSPAGDAAQFLRGVTLADLQRKETWPKLRGVALIRPNGDILPVRAVFHANDAQDTADPTLRAQQIGVNVVMSGPPTWWSFADVIASKILNGDRCPEILRTITLEPHGVQSGLKPIKFFGEPNYEIDLTRDDLFQRVIDMRGEVKNDNPAMGLGLKLLASATSYGALIEFIVDEHKTPRGTTVYHGTQSTRRLARAALPSDDGGFEISGYKAERAGAWFAPWGPLIPAGGRLLLAIAERLAADCGLGYAFCDTDSMAFVRPNGMGQDDFRARVQEIAGQRGWFQALNPYSNDDALFSIEPVNYAHDDPKQLEPLYVLAVSAKRYALANRRGEEWIIRKATGHGLGHITAPAYDKAALPPHPAAPIDKETGKPQLEKLSNSRNPKLVCDLWRIAFEAGARGDDIQLAAKEALKKLRGLSEPQFQQRALSSRADWLAYERLPDKRAFMFFNILPAPVSSDWTFATNDPEINKTRDDLLKTTLYAKAGKDFLDKDSLRRSDNNECPAEIFHDAFGLRLCTVADCLWDYFDHSEMKSRGEKGLLQRRKMVILDHEYIGKETNSLIDPDVEAAGDEEIEDAPNIPIFRRGFNPSLLTGLDMDALSDRTGVKPETLRDAFRRGRRLEPQAMKRLRASLEISEDGAVSIAEAAPMPADARRAARIARQLQTLHDALAKGKDFDLNGARRPALKNERRGPVPLTALRLAVERHLPDNAARRFFKDRVGVFWSGGAAIYANNERELGLIEDAIALASGAKRARHVRRARAGVTALQKGTEEERLKARGRKTERQRQARVARNAAVEAVFAMPINASPPPMPASSGIPPDGAPKGVPEGHPAATPDFFSSDWADKFGPAICALIAAVVVLITMFKQFPRQIEAARKAAIRRASPDTAWAVFAADLQERIERRLKRAEADKLRKRRARRSQNKRAHPSGGIGQQHARRRAFGDDDTQKVASEADAPARVVNADKVAAAELLTADEGEYASFD
jgi:hypothetical protein